MPVNCSYATNAFNYLLTPIKSNILDVILELKKALFWFLENCLLMDLIAFLKNSCIQNHRELWKLFCMCWMSLWTLLVFVCSCMSPIKWKSPRGTSPTRTTRASRRKRRSNGRKRQRKSSDCSPTPGQCRRPRVCHQV